MVWFYGISTMVDYSMPNTVYKSIKYLFGLAWFYGISTIVGYSIPNIIYTYIKYMVWFGLVL